VIELVGKVESLVNNEVVKADTDARDRMGVIGDHPKTKGNGHEQTGEIVEMKEGPLTCSGRSQCAFETEPHNQDRGETAKHISAQGLKERRMLCHKIRQKREEIVHGRHLYLL
jgi:hypothetical protein